MTSIDQQLAREEHVCYRARLHWIVLVGPCVVAAGFGIVGPAPHRGCGDLLDR